MESNLPKLRRPYHRTPNLAAFANVGPAQNPKQWLSWKIGLIAILAIGAPAVWLSLTIAESYPVADLVAEEAPVEAVDSWAR